MNDTSPEPAAPDSPTNVEGHPEARQFDGRWVLFGFPIIIFGIAIVAAIVLQHWQLLTTLVCILAGWGVYLGLLELHHRRTHRE